MYESLMTCLQPVVLFPAFAASTEGQSSNSSEHLVVIFIAEIALMLLVGRLLGELMQRIGQPAVMGQLIAGILLGPSVFGALWPSAHNLIFPDVPGQKRMIDAISQLGILMLLLLTGMETDLALVKRMRRTAIFTSLSGIALPFACGFLLGQFIPDSLIPDPGRRLITSLFLATTLSISSVKIVAMVIMEVDFMRRNIGQIILASAILDDTVGWIIIAVIGGLAAQGAVKITGLAFTVLGTAAFLIFSFTLGRRLVAFVIRWTNDRLLIEMPVITAILILMLLMSLVTDYIGVHTVLGAFVVGILVGESPILTRHIEEQLRGLIVALFAPVFFAVAGLAIDLSILKSLRLIALAIGLILIASFGKLVGCYVGGKLGGLNNRESLALAFGMNARGSTEVIVATIGLSMGVLNTDLFTLIVVMAISTTMVMPPMLRWALARIPPTGEEKERLEREKAEAKDYLPKIERLLIAADQSAHGRLASRLAGLFIGSRQIMATVLDLNHSRAQARATDSAAEAVKATAEAASRKLQQQDNESRPTANEMLLTNEAATTDVPRAVLSEIEKGYDMLFLGLDGVLEDPHHPNKQTGAAVEKILQEFDGAVAIVIAKNDHPRGDGDRLRILVPTTGTDYSRRAAEVAIALARAGPGRVTALHVAPPPREISRQAATPRAVHTGHALVRDIERLGEREGVRVRPLVVYRREPEPAIIEQVKKGDYDLVVLGAKARPDEQVFFGHSMAVLMERIPCSIVMVSS
jgi:Kef-type K+ transport system membrane component KefB/nucleotide-binding universal stress UspA family protein